MSNKWILYAVKDSDAEVVAAFVARYGIKPREIRRTGGGTLVGPIPIKEEGNDDRLEARHVGGDSGL